MSLGCNKRFLYRPTCLLLLIALFLFRCGDGGLEPDPGDYPEIYGFQDLDGNEIYGAESGSEIYVLGANFSIYDDQVLFGDQEAAIDQRHSTARELRVTVPNFSTAQTVAVTVSAKGQQSDPALFHISLPRYYPIGEQTNSVMTEDLNGDGVPDLTVLHSGGLSILTGKGNGTFKGPEKYMAGQDPVSVKFEDLNNDGALDVVALKSTYPEDPENISILLGKGDGTFLEAPSFTAGNKPCSLEIADLNNDGHFDLAVANQGDNAEHDRGVTLLLGKGDGSFENPAFFPTGDGKPCTLKIEDLNTDGNLDLIVLNRKDSADYPETVSILLGKGEGAFLAPTRFITGHHSLSLRLEDLNKDGNLDLAVLNRGPSPDYPSNVSVLLNNGDGSFQEKYQFPTTGRWPLAFELEDLNNDGNLDLAVLNAWGSMDSSGHISILLGNGEGIFHEADLFVVNDPSALSFEDLNRDGFPDLIVMKNNYNISEGPGSVSILLGNGDGSFQTASFLADDFKPKALLLEDLNMDGNPDLTILNTYLSSIHVLLGVGDGTFMAPPTYRAGEGPKAIKAGDLNGDRINDLVVANDRETISILLGNRNGTFKAPIEYAACTFPKSIVIQDLNHDNAPDLAVAGSDQPDWQGVVSILQGNGDGSFKQPESYPTGKMTNSIAAGDLNNDGHTDMVTTNTGILVKAQWGNVSILFGNGDTTFQEAIQLIAGPYPNSVSLADLNHDGNLDLTIVNLPTGILSYLGLVAIRYGNGDGTFKRPIYFSGGEFPFAVAIGDLNLDGQPDLVVSAINGNISVLLGNRYGTFQRLDKTMTNNYCSYAAMGDLDHDGRQDLAITNRLFGGYVSILYGNGDGTFEKTIPYGTGTLPCSVAIADLDGIGPLDLAVANSRSNDVTVILNPER